MGRIAEALRANLREIVESDARSLRETDQELKAARAAVGSSQLKQVESVKALLGQGTFMQQTKPVLQQLCKEHGIKRYSQLNKTELAKLLKKNGVEAPPRSVESFSKKELVALVKKLLGM